MMLWWKLHHEVRYYRNKDYGITLNQMGVVISEIESNKSKVEKSDKVGQLSWKFWRLLT